LCDSSGITLILEEKSIPVLAYFYFENRSTWSLFLITDFNFENKTTTKRFPFVLPLVFFLFG